MFLAPLNAAGIEIQPIRTFGNERTNVVYFGDVRIPDRYRIGAVNDGWAVLRGPLDEEHGTLPDSADRPLRETSQGATSAHMLERALDAAAAWAVTARPDGTRPADDPLVVYRLGEIEMEIRAALCTPDPMGRVFGSEALIRGAAALIDLVGPEALVSEGVPGALGGGHLDFTHRYAQGTATYGGTVEVFRNIIAQHVLGLPRPFYPGSTILDRNGAHGH
jgi:alkylation response protein AidB-like acyl-CoA dehydrogenase